MTAQHILSTSTLIGAQVINSLGEDVGKIDELMIDIDSGRIAYAVLTVGGFLGIGDKHFAIPWQAFRHSPQRNDLIVDISREKLESAPGFDKGQLPAMADQTWGNEIHNHYGYTPYWQESPPQDRVEIEDHAHENYADLNTGRPHH